MKFDDNQIPYNTMTFNPNSGKHENRFPGRSVSKNGKFIKGPIPFDWLKLANTLPGKAGAVGTALWFLKGIKKLDTFKITAQILELSGCTRQALNRALTNLETAKLIKIQPKQGSRHTVTILEITDEAD